MARNSKDRGLRVLIIYDEVPENTTFYEVIVTPEEWAWMRLTHRQMVNADMTPEAEDACNKLSEWLEGKPKLDGEVPFCGRDYDFVLFTGFLL